MCRFRLTAPLPLVCVALLSLMLTGLSSGQAPVFLATAQGEVDRVEKDSLTVRPRTAEGRFAKSLTLRLTGTSKISSVAEQKRAGKTVLVQKDVEPKTLQPGQRLALIYAPDKDGGVLLSAVVQVSKTK
jgi:hypothetical protein